MRTNFLESHAIIIIEKWRSKIKPHALIKPQLTSAAREKHDITSSCRPGFLLRLDGGGNRGDVLLAAFVSESLPSSFFADDPKFSSQW
jgi:hypothetical protein